MTRVDDAIQVNPVEGSAEPVSELTQALEPMPGDTFEISQAKHILGNLLSPLQSLIAGDTTEIMINTCNNIWVEDGQGMHKVPATLDSGALETAIVAIGRLSDVDAGADHPIVDARIGARLRVGAVLPPAAAEGPTLCIRRHRPIQAHLGMYGVAGEVALGLLQEGVNILVAGSTGSGKTTFVNALLAALSASDRLLVLEDTPELDVRSPNHVRLEARAGADMGALLRQTLRQRPDRIVLGEVRGHEAYELLQAFNTGHGGSFSTIHAGNPQGALMRMASLIGQADEARSWPQSAIRAAIAESVGAVVCLKHREVTDIVRVVGMIPDGHFDLKDVLTPSVDSPDKG
ncbi:MAG: Flp pilus assembly complex ATPase component TadA [Sinobacteraceae bacterium]|nr:Flp pilus assembly complex ATPase component TadA [Nevskiaceae bacterium]